MRVRIPLFPTLFSVLTQVHLTHGSRIRSRHDSESWFSGIPWIENPFTHPKILSIRVMIFHCLWEDQEHPSCTLNCFLQDLCFWFDNCNPSRSVLYWRQHAHKVEKPVHLLKYVLCTSILEQYAMYFAQRLKKALDLTNSLASKTYLAFIPLVISLFEFLDIVPHKLDQDIFCKLFRAQIIILWMRWWRARLLRRC